MPMDRAGLPRKAAAFDAQAESFDRRAGLPADARAAIARALVEMAGLGPERRIIDIGAGTGEIGLPLIGLGVAYIGLDESAAMLAVFERRAAREGHRPSLLVSDARDPWPVPACSASAVFGSRSLHWMDPTHVVAETIRVAAPTGAVLLVGRVARDPDGPRERVRQAMRELLLRAGYEGRSQARSSTALISECVCRGATAILPRVVASWTTERAPREVLDDWRSKPGLAGLDVPELVKEEVLAQVARFTSETFGNIDTPILSSERYVVEGATLNLARS